MIPRNILEKVKRIEIRTRGLVNDLFGGEYHSVFKGRGMTFSEVREYEPGDDIRLIDWIKSYESGIFTFQITINAEDQFGTITDLESVNQISLTEVSHHLQTLEQGPVEFRVKSYYERGFFDFRLY